jgi:ABC-type amino acid transport substrate-binding protein
MCLLAIRLPAFQNVGVMVKKIPALFLAALCLWALPCRADTVRVGHPTFLGPLMSVKNGKTTGLVASVLRAAAKRARLQIVFVPMSSGYNRALRSGAVDAVAPMLITSKVRNTYDFTEVLVVTQGGLFVRAPQDAPSDLAKLSGKTIVTPSFGPFVAYIRKQFPAVHVVPTSSYNESLDRVLAGSAYAAALNVEEGAATVAASYAGKISVPTTPFLKEPLGLAVAKGTHADLVRRLNEALAAMRSDGTLARIERDWRH